MKLTKSLGMGCLALASLTAVSIFSSCKKSNDANNTAGISASLGGKAWQSTTVDAEDNGFGTLTLIGFRTSDTSVLNIGILDAIKVNQADPLDNSEVWFGKHDGTTYTGATSFGGHGSLTVTSWDTAGHKIAGVFSGVFYNTANDQDSMVVTGGHFNNSYTVTP